MPYNYDTLMEECPDESNAAKFFQNYGLLHAERFCHCSSQMRPSTASNHGNQMPVWRCPTKNCKASESETGYSVLPIKISIPHDFKIYLLVVNRTNIN